MSFTQKALCNALQARRLLCKHILQAHTEALQWANTPPLNKWNILLGDRLIFDQAGLQAIAQAIQSYQGSANELLFKLQLSKEAIRDYYSHNVYLQKGLVTLPIRAIKKTGGQQKKATICIKLDELSTRIDYPLSLTIPDKNSTPLALLMPYSCEHDCLFANQIAIFSNLNQQLRQSPASWIKALLSRRKISLKRRIALSWKQVHASADIHPTAIIEGSVIGDGCRIGAHCVVRYSVLGNNVVLHDGAKVEYSVVDDNSWLMHDLVLYRSLTESNVFLIHGPYQFSYFQKQSAAFANIMMDYRPDNRPIRISTPNGVRDYHGRFLGALLKEKARVFGGTLTAPGISIPSGKEITCNIEAITTAKKLQ